MKENEMIKRYQEYREIGKGVNGILINLLSRDVTIHCATLLGLTDEAGNLRFDSEAGTDHLGDFSVHDYRDENGETTLTKLVKSNDYESLTNDEKNIIQAKVNAFQSLFLVDYVKPSEGFIGLKDVYDGFKSIEIIDIGLSQSVKAKETYIFTRIMQLETFSCTTGVASVFSKNKLVKIKKAYLKGIKKHPKLKLSTKKSVVFFHINKRYGKKISFE